MGRVQPNESGATPRLVVLGAIQKQAKHTMESKPVWSVPSSSPHQLLLSGSSSVGVSALTSISNEVWLHRWPPELTSRILLIWMCSFCALLMEGQPWETHRTTQTRTANPVGLQAAATGLKHMFMLHAALDIWRHSFRLRVREFILKADVSGHVIVS